MTRIVIVASLLALGCGNKKTPESPPPPPAEPDAPAMVDADSDADSGTLEPVLDGSLAIVNTRWELRAIDGEAVELEPDSRPVFFRVDVGEPSDLAGFAGCNRLYGTAFSATASTVSFGPIGTTRMACPNLGAEQTFLATLGKADRWTVDGDTLTLMAGSESTLVFERVADEDAFDE